MTIGGNNNNKLIKDWIRLLQKSLTIETETNTLIPLEERNILMTICMNHLQN